MNLQTIYPFYITAIKGFIFAIILCKASINDIRTREVENDFSIIIILTALIGIGDANLTDMLSGALFVPLPMFITAVLKPGKIGGADIKIMAASGFLLGFAKGMKALTIGFSLPYYAHLSSVKSQKEA